ncbi:MAG: pilin [Candidatus Thiodiazotropha sp.]
MQKLRSGFVRYQQQGFTLLELVSVVAIIGILAASAIPPYQRYVKREKLSEAFLLTDSVREAVVDFYVHTGRMPRDNTEAGLIEANKLTGNYVTSIQVEDGAIHITSDLGECPEISPEILTLRPELQELQTMAPVLGWSCGYANPVEGMQLIGQDRTTIDPELLPVICRNSIQ